MKFVYAPEGATPREWDFAPGRMSAKDAIDIERLSGMRFSVWREEVTGGSMLATKTLLFVLLRRDSQGLSWDSLDFRPDDCVFLFEDDEQRRILASLEERAAAGPLSDAQATYLRVLRETLPDESDGPQGAPEGDAADPTQPVPEPAPSKRTKRAPSGSA